MSKAWRIISLPMAAFCFIGALLSTFVWSNVPLVVGFIAVMWGYIYMFLNESKKYENRIR